MPHDRHGIELLPGDEVVMRFRVKPVSSNGEYCNLNLESVYPLYPGEYATSLSAVNSRQVEKHSKLPFGQG